MNNDAGEKFVTGLIIGTVLGLAIGIFTAPISGEESRRIVREKVDEFGKKARDRFDEFGKQIKHGAAGSD